MTDPSRVAARRAAPVPISLAMLLDDLQSGGPSKRWPIPAELHVSSGTDPAAVPLVDATHDSRRVTAGSVFIAVRGATTDGHDHVADAVSRGAAAVVVEALPVGQPVTVPTIVVADSRQAMGPVAAAVHRHPAERLVCVGITGTNGKTTTAHLLHAVLTRAGHPTEVIGTLTQARTTPEATDLQARLAEAVRAGKTYVVMEVTSHALVLNRVDGMHFAVACFTNLSQDHLDFHSTMEAYFRAKADLFTPRRADRAVVYAEDPYGRLLLDAASIPTTGFGLGDVSGLDLGALSSGFVWRSLPVRLAMGGSFNVVNAVAAAACAEALGVAPEHIASGLTSAGVVPGRFETVDAGQRFAVVVDFAHTPDGLARVLAAARGVADRNARVVVVFGCGGDRDRAKRPEMGRIAAELADVVIVTSDNPRSEDPAAILADVLAGVATRDTVSVEPDRELAIAQAFEQAGDGDIVVIAGKGHEAGQEIAGVVHPFDDREVARRLLGARA